MKCPVCDRRLDMSLVTATVRCSCGAYLISNGRFLAWIVLWAWVIATIAMFLIMGFVTNAVWPWFFGADLLFIVLVAALASRFWHVKVARP